MCQSSIVDDEEPVDVLNLPQLYQRPSAESLLSILAELSVTPPSWSGTSSASKDVSAVQSKRKIKGEGVPAYLTKIIGSPLHWIEDDAEKEQIWETAAQRLSERSGRTGMGDITRVFEIPLATSHVDSESGGGGRSHPEARMHQSALRFTIHEPALSEDSLGLKTWASSYLLAKRLPLIRSTLPTTAEILELGAGTGLVGMAAAATFQCLVLQTDLPAIVPNLTRNAQANADEITSRGGSIRTAVLDWSSPQIVLPSYQQPHQDGNAEHDQQTFHLILAADPIYSPSHPTLLVNAIGYHLTRTADARVVIELPLREAFGAERQDLWKQMEGLGLKLLDHGEEVGFDDWTDGKGEELAEVRCWWGVWGWGVD